MTSAKPGPSLVFKGRVVGTSEQNGQPLAAVTFGRRECAFMQRHGIPHSPNVSTGSRLSAFVPATPSFNFVNKLGVGAGDTVTVMVAPLPGEGNLKKGYQIGTKKGALTGPDGVLLKPTITPETLGSLSDHVEAYHVEVPTASKPKARKPKVEIAKVAA